MKKKINVFSIIGVLLIVVMALSSIYFIYSVFQLNEIENFLRYCLMIFIGAGSLLLSVLLFRFIMKRKKLGIIILMIVVLIYSIFMGIVGLNINLIFGKIGNMIDKTSTLSSSIVTLKSNVVDNIGGIGDAKIGIYNDTKSEDGYIIPKEIMAKNNLKNELVEYDDYFPLITALLEEEIDYIFLPTNYKILFKGTHGFEDLGEVTKIIYTLDKSVGNEINNNINISKEPFSILLMGVDSEEETLSDGFNGDALILVTFNPNSLKATLLSIPRDTYVPISCFSSNRKNKITHAAPYGEECMKKTIENLFDMKIDYTVKINFKGLVKLVDELGGIEVDVPYAFCEQNSNREFGDNMIYVESGLQVLNGEQALALARNRKTNSNYCDEKWTHGTRNDFVRGENQQKIIIAMLDKLKGVRNISVIYDLLDTISNSMSTTLSENQILSLYNVGKVILQKSRNDKIENIITLEALGIEGYDYNIYEPSMKLDLYNFVPYNGSIKDISDAMKTNLGVLPITPVKEFQFSINNPYQKLVIGKGDYNESRIPLLPDFVGEDLSYAEDFCSNNGIRLIIDYASTNTVSNNSIIGQSVPSNSDVSYVYEIKITVAKAIEVPVIDDTEETDET